jgi:hypothetical protein
MRWILRLIEADEIDLYIVIFYRNHSASLSHALATALSTRLTSAVACLHTPPLASSGYSWAWVQDYLG